MVPTYKTLYVLFTTFVFLLVPTNTKVFAQETTYVPNEVIVKFKNYSDLEGSFSSENVKGVSTTSSEQVLETAKAQGTLTKFDQTLDIKKVKTVVPIKTKNLYGLNTQKNELEKIVKIKYNNNISPKEVAKRLSADPNIEWSEPNFIKKVYAAEPNDPFFPLQWSLKNTGQNGGVAGNDINILKAWDIQKTAENIHICYIDTGGYAFTDYFYTEDYFDINTGYSSNNIFWKNPGEIPGNEIDDDGNGVIDDVYGANTTSGMVGLPNAGCNEPGCGVGHGSLGISVIASVPNNNAAMSGIIQKKANITDIESLLVSGGSVEDVVKGMDYAISVGCKIINASYGSGHYSELENEAMQQAKNAGILFVAAAGNDGKNLDTNPSYPANYDFDNIISVAATNNKGELASFSNYSNTKAHIAAPGEKIPVQSNKWAHDVDYVDGTSFSAPHVTAVSALVWAKNPEWDYKKVREAILKGGRTNQSLQGKVLNAKTLDAYGALTYGTNTPTPTPNSPTPTPSDNKPTPTPTNSPTPTPSVTLKYNPKYDVNKDEKVNILDAITIIEYLFR